MTSSGNGRTTVIAPTPLLEQLLRRSRLVLGHYFTSLAGAVCSDRVDFDVFAASLPLPRARGARTYTGTGRAVVCEVTYLKRPGLSRNLALDAVG